MRELALFDKSDDPETREARSAQAVDEVIALRQSRAWNRLDEFIQKEIEFRLSCLERVADHDDMHRGALEVLRYVKDWPYRIERLAINELKLHRGT